MTVIGDPDLHCKSRQPCGHRSPKAVLRLLIDQVVVTTDNENEWVNAVVHWAGGHKTDTRFCRPVAKLTQLKAHAELVARIHELRRGGYTAGRIASKLNAEGWRTPTQRNAFNDRLIHAIMLRHGSVPRGKLAPPTDDPDDWRLADLAKELDMPLPTLYGWRRRELLKSRRVKGEWVVTADRRKIRRLPLITRSISGHLTERMQDHDATVQAAPSSGPASPRSLD